jgi:L-asparagine oxygenase
MHQTALSDEEFGIVARLLDSVCAEHSGVDDPRLVESAPLYAQELPLRIRKFFVEFRAAQPSALCVLSGLPVDDEAVGPTPAASGHHATRSPALHHEVFFLLCAALLGDVFPGGEPAEGRIMPDVVPDKGDQDGRLAASLSWRTEHPFSPVPADYVGLLCLRNPDNVATAICAADWVEWSRVDVDLLFSAEYPIRVDGLEAHPSNRPVLFGDHSRPFLAVDPALVVREAMTPRARAAFDAFVRAVDDALNGFVLWPGDMAFIDNLRAVHGHEPFEARHDGTDRWLKRLTIARDRRRSESATVHTRMS